jgi:F-type H+-transporting ATPase subunit a
MINIILGGLAIRAVIMKEGAKSHFIIPNRIQFLFENYHSFIYGLVRKKTGSKRASTYLPLIFTLAFYMLCLNLSGLVPSSGAMLSHGIVTVTISGSFFIGMNLICIRHSNIELFRLFLPPNTPVWIAAILVPVEALSFVCRPLSLATRLFANSIGGHTLIKIVAGCGWSSLALAGPLGVGCAGLILTFLFALEFTVAMIQSSVFLTLICLYIGEGMELL